MPKEDPWAWATMLIWPGAVVVVVASAIVDVVVVSAARVGRGDEPHAPPSTRSAPAARTAKRCFTVLASRVEIPMTSPLLAGERHVRRGHCLGGGSPRE